MGYACAAIVPEHPTMDILSQFSAALADRVAGAAASVVALRLDDRPRAGILWRPDVVVASEQTVGQRDSVGVVRGGIEVEAKLAGRDPGTNVAVFRLETALPGALVPAAEAPRVGSLAVILGADDRGAATGRLAMVHAVGPEWHAMAGGRIDALIRLDARLGADEGGPVLDAAGGLLGMSASGPHRRVLVIPTATIARVVDPILEHGRVARGWLGVGLEPVALSEASAAATGQRRGAMVLNAASGGPADNAGVLAGDILLEMDGRKFGHRRPLSLFMGPERIGQTVTLRLLRAGEPRTISLTIAARPGG
jgi:S1-C subfamily serine protease